MYSQFGEGPLLYLCCSSHVPLLYIFCPPVVHPLCSCAASQVPVVPLLLFSSPSTLPQPFTWGHWEDLKMAYRGTLLSLFCSSSPHEIRLFKHNNHPICVFLSREVSWFKLHSKADFPNSSHNAKLFSLLGGRAINRVNRGSMVSLKPQTLPCPARGAWHDCEHDWKHKTNFRRDDKFHSWIVHFHK